MRLSLRPTLLFFTAHALNTTAHELAHALMAYSLGIRSTLFQFYVNPEFTGPQAHERVMVAVAGPLFSMVFGLVCWLAYKKTRFESSKLSWLYTAILGISIFLGNLFSIPSVGDFGTAAVILNVPPSVRLSISIVSMGLICMFLYSMGQELVKWAPHGFSRTRAMAHMVVIPAVLGTGVTILAFLPMPAQFIAGWLATSFFWLFTAGGAYVAPKYATAGGDLRTRPMEYVAAAVMLAVVRILVSGVSLAP